jgi:hypothetical protein
MELVSSLCRYGPVDAPRIVAGLLLAIVGAALLLGA